MSVIARQLFFLAPAWLLLGARGAEPTLDLAHAVVLTAKDMSTPERKAAAMLAEEVARRSWCQWPRVTAWPEDNRPVIAIGTSTQLQSLFTRRERGQPALPDASEGFSIWSEPQPRPVIWIAGHDSRGVLFGVGRLLRALDIQREKVLLPANFQVATAPRLALRGHQLGYRPKCNSYDGWNVAMWEQYIRDLVVFGCNAIELIPPRSDDDADSPHFPLPQMQMMSEMSRLAGDYELEVWLWYPAMDKDYSDAKTVEFALREWAEVFRKLPRINAVFVPGGDPGHTQPKHLFALLQKQATNLRRFHPRAEMWVSPQSFTRSWMDEFLELLKAEPAWLAGVVYGPQVRMPLAELRERVPTRYPIRDYPDITHSRHCQYPVPDWDVAYAVTEGREIINPRPEQMRQIFQATTRQHAFGFISYSEGCNDDVNKAIWSALGWNPDADLREALRDYSRYFIGAQRAEAFTEGLLGLEKNWEGAILTNTNIEATFEQFRALERSATPAEKLNWRFQQALYRSYYDTYVRRRLNHETTLEQQALKTLARSVDAGAPGEARLDSIAAIKQASEILDSADTAPAAADLRARLCELAEALFQSIRMQLSVERYAGMRGRGNNLDDVDQPLNNRPWLRLRLTEIERMTNEEERLRALGAIVHWSDPGAGGFYDDLGDPSRQPHLLRGAGWEKDPGFYATPQVGFTERVRNGVALPRSWWTAAESLYDATIQMRYTDLDKTALYKLRVVYGRYRNSAKVRLVANDSIEVHSWLQKEAEPLEFDIPAAATSTGELKLTWLPEPGHGENGRVMEVAEVWLIRR